MLDSPWEELLHYGLLVGAVIQLVAIAAIFVLPSSPEDEQNETKEKGAEPADTKTTAPAVSSSKKGRKDKTAARRRR